MPFIPLQSYTEKGMARAVSMTPEEQNWGEEKSTHDTELDKEIARTKDPRTKQVLIEEKSKRAQRKAESPPTPAPVKSGFIPLSQVPQKPSAPQGFFGEMWSSLKGFDLSHNMFARMIDMAGENSEVANKVRQSPAWNAEVAKMKKDHPDYSAEQSHVYMQNWLSDQVGAEFRKKHGDKPQGEDKPVSDMMKDVVKIAYQHPGMVAGELLKGVGEDPELLLPVNWELGVAKAVERLGAVAKGVARTAEVGAGMAAIQAPISATQQLQETGEIRPKQVAKEAAVAGVAGAVLHASIKLAAGSVAAKTGKVVPPAKEIEAIKDIVDQVKAGTPVEQAANAVFKAMGLPEQDAAPIAKELASHATEEREVPKDDQREHIGTNAPRVEEAQPQADRGNRPVAGKEVRPKEEEGLTKEVPMTPEMHKAADRQFADNEKAVDNIGKERAARYRQLSQKIRDGSVTDVEGRDWDRLNKMVVKEATKLAEIRRAEKVVSPLPEGIGKGQMVQPKEAAAILEMSGMDPETARLVGDKPIAIGALRQRLTKFMDGQHFSDNTLLDAVKKGLLKGQSGQIDPWLVKYLAAVGIGGASAYALTGDKDKAIKVALAVGAVPIAMKVANKVGSSVRSVWNRFAADKSFHADEPMRAYFAQTKIIHHAVDVWSRTTDALLTGVPDREASKIRARDWVQGYRDVELTPQEQAYANAIKSFLDHVGSQAQDAGVIKQLREDYLTGLYQKQPFKKWADVLRELATEDSFRGNYTGMGRSSRHNLQKVIPDYRTAEALHAQGKFPLIPLTNDPVAIAAHYAKSVQKTMAVRKLINDLKSTPSNRISETGRAVPVIVGDTPFETAQRIAAVNHKIGEKMGFPPERIEAQTRAQILNAPSDYVYIKHPSLEGLRVHSDVAPVLKMIFDTSDPGMLQKLLYAGSMATKGLFFTVSLFHPWALLDVLGAVALPRAKFLASLPKYWKSIGGARQMLNTSEGAPGIKVAADAGLNIFHSISDVDPGYLQRLLNSMQMLAGEKAGRMVQLPFKALAETHKWFQNLLWNEIHPTLKLATFNAELQNAILKNPKGDVAKMGKQIAAATNDLFGGQNWFEMANTIPGALSRKIALSLFSPQGRRLQQILFLSPDWNISAGRAWYNGLKSVMPGVDRKASDSMYRGYLVWSALTYLGAANALSNAFTGKNIWDQKDWTYVDIGDGRKIQLNKHFMEMMHLTHNPVQFITNKLNLYPREVIEQIMGKDWMAYNTQKQEFYGPPMDTSAAGRLAHAGQTVIPISLANIFRDPVSGMITWLTGRPIYGTRYEERDKQAEDRAAENARKKGKSPEMAREASRLKRQKAAQKRSLEESRTPSP